MSIRDFDDFEKNLFLCVEKTLARLNIKNVPVIPSMSSMPTPKGDKIFLTILGMNQIGQRITGGRVQDGTHQEPSGKYLKFFTRQYQTDVQVVVMGDNAFSLGSKIHTNIKSREDITSVWFKHAIPILTVTNLRSSPQLMDTVWNKGYSFDIKVNFMIHEDYEVNTIDSVKFTTKLIGVDGDLVTDEVIDGVVVDPNEGVILFGFEDAIDTLGFADEEDLEVVGGIYKTKINPLTNKLKTYK